MVGGIYLIECLVNDTTYIGSAKNFEKRFGAHLKDLSNNSHRNPHLQHSFNKYGKDSLKFIKAKILGEYNKSLYFAEENALILSYQKQGKKIFNIAKAEGGWSYATFERKEEIKRKISETLKEQAAQLTAEERSLIYGKGNRGIPLSNERKKYLSEFWKNKPKSEETRAKMKIAQNTEEAKERHRKQGSKVGKSRIGCKPWNFGKSFSEESREKMRQAKLGRKLSEEHKANIKKSAIARRKEQLLNIT